MAQGTQGDHAGGAPGETRLSVLAGDRLCTGCGYNLVGQPVLREPHYAMLIVRCPECGAVASVQEYPLLGRWPARWAALLAAAWFAVLVVLVVATAGILAAGAHAVAQRASVPFAEHIAQLHADYQKQQPAGGQFFGSGAYSFVDGNWASQQDFEAILGAARGWRSVLNLRALRGWGLIAVPAFVSGCFWAVIFLHARRGRLLLLGAVPVLLAGIFSLLTATLANRGMFGWVSAISLAQRQVGTPILAASLAFTYLPLVAGLLAGRPIVRGLIRALLPPRMRGALALLWITDGLEPPRVPARRMLRRE